MSGKSLKVVFMGTPDFSVPSLVALSEHYEVVGVYTQPDRPVGRGRKLTPSPVKAKALELGLDVFQPEKVSVGEAFEGLAHLQPDIIAVVAYGQILRENVIRLAPLGCVNVHSSLLPRWRGAAPIQWAILAGDTETGVSTMKIVKELDAGDVYQQIKTPIHSTDTGQSVHDRLAELGAQLLIETFKKLQAGQTEATPQDETQVTYASKLTKEMEILDPTKTSEELDRQVRALTPWPGTSLLLADGERIKVKKARLADATEWSSVSQSFSGQGDLVAHANQIYLLCREGALALEVLQWEGKKPVDAPGFIHGLRGRGRDFPLSLQNGQN